MVARLAVVVLAAAALLPWVPPGAALVAGIAFALAFGNPAPKRTAAASHLLLQLSVVGLGAGMDLEVVGRVGLHGLGYTAVGISAAAGIGYLLTRALRVRRDAAILVTCGTAICGGSAIAAVAPAIGARDDDTSVALAVVFTLNAIALLAFPPIGHAVGLSQDQFGLWAALAIHDTSSVVGAASHYGAQALAVATAAKLARALWIVPVTAVAGYVARRDVDGAAAGDVDRAAAAAGDVDGAAARDVSRAAAGDVDRAAARDVGAPAPARRARKPRRPWFIAGFVAAAALVTFVPALRPAGDVVATVARRLLAATLFLVGLGLTRSALKAIGPRPLGLALGLWVALAAGSLAAIATGLI